ncbi:MAG: hypothetical protein GEU99_17065 [Luteitalea sp.]|nr:hypothetical protein [Luteitalea sp.]
MSFLIDQRQIQPLGVVISENRVSRRLALQSLAAGLGASVAWAQDAEAAEHPIVRHLHQGAERKPATGGLARLLDEHQFQTLSALAEIVVPGAKATESDVFIDTLLAVESTETKRRFLSALGAIEGAAIAEHRKPFLDLTTAEQTALLTAISEQPAGHDLTRDAPGRTVRRTTTTSCGYVRAWWEAAPTCGDATAIA